MRCVGGVLDASTASRGHVTHAGAVAFGLVSQAAQHAKATGTIPAEATNAALLCESALSWDAGDAPAHGYNNSCIGGEPQGPHPAECVPGPHGDHWNGGYEDSLFEREVLKTIADHDADTPLFLDPRTHRAVAALLAAALVAQRARTRRAVAAIDEEQALASSKKGRRLLGWAGYGQDARMVPFLLERGAVLNDEICCPAGTGNEAILRAFLAAGADPDGLSPGWGARPLHVAASLRYTTDAVPAARLLLEAGADVNGPAADGHTTALDVVARELDRAGSENPRRREGLEKLHAFLVSQGARRGRV